MQRTNIYLDEDQLLALKQVAVHQRRSVAAVVREAVDQYLEQALPREVLLQQLEDLIAQIHQRVPLDVSSEEIEADITRAREELRRERRAARRD